MAFCINCGHEVPDGAKFCANCGKAIGGANTGTQRKTTYDGELHKCPNCGEIINSFDLKCKACGFELRGRSGANKIQELEFDINTIRQYCNNNDLEDIEMKFDSKVKLTKGESVVTTLKANDICDIQKQIKIYAYDEESGKYKYINPEFKMNTSSNTIYRFITNPVEIVPNIDTDIITLKNTTNWPLIIYLFKLS